MVISNTHRNVAILTSVVTARVAGISRSASRKLVDESAISLARATLKGAAKGAKVALVE